jgi:hypothetical protein
LRTVQISNDPTYVHGARDACIGHPYTTSNALRDEHFAVVGGQPAGDVTRGIRLHR